MAFTVYRSSDFGPSRSIVVEGFATVDEGFAFLQAEYPGWDFHKDMDGEHMDVAFWKSAMMIIFQIEKISD